MSDETETETETISPEIEALATRIDAMLDFMVSTDEPEGLSIHAVSPIWEGFGLAVRRLGKKIYRIGGHETLLASAQLIVIRNPADRNARMEILSRHWDGIGGAS